MNGCVQLIIGNLLAASVIGGVAWCVGRSGRRSGLAHLLWLMFFVKLITPPLVSVPIAIPQHWMPAAMQVLAGDAVAPRETRDRVAVVAQPLVAGSPVIAADASPSLLTRLGSVDRRSVVGVVWIVGFVALIVHGLIRFVRFHRLVRLEGKLDREASDFVRSLVGNSVRHRHSTSRFASPEVLRLPMRVSPMLFGFGRRAVIVCPDPLWHSLSELERHVLLAHETAHFCRRDHRVRWLEWLVTAIYWWFPGVYLARRQLERHEESCCDAWAVNQLAISPRQYADSLLRVVDFICDHSVGVPRLASAMQPTDSLAERLRLLMRRPHGRESSPATQWISQAAVVAVWLMHPVLQPQASAGPSIGKAIAPFGTVVPLAPGLAELATAGEVLPDIELPEAPGGFWNYRPGSEWANEPLAFADARVIADAIAGPRIEVPQRDSIGFASAEFSALVDLASTERVVIGDAQGRVRLWDLAAGVPVSLIGKHKTGVTSLAHRDSVGLFSADSAGSVIRWDVQSGTPLATWTSERWPVQSIRLSDDGKSLAILLGGWNRAGDELPLHIVDSRTLELEHAATVPGTTAIVLSLPDLGWVAVDWTGAVKQLHRTTLIDRVAKHRVSALLLFQNAPLTGSNQPTP